MILRGALLGLRAGPIRYAGDWTGTARGRCDRDEAGCLAEAGLESVTTPARLGHQKLCSKMSTSQPTLASSVPTFLSVCAIPIPNDPPSLRR